MRHRDLVNKLKNNYSTNAAGRASSSNIAQTSDRNEPSSSRLNHTEESSTSPFKYNFLSKASIDSYKNKLSSTLPSFLSKKTNFNGLCVFFRFPSNFILIRIILTRLQIILLIQTMQANKIFFLISKLY